MQREVQMANADALGRTATVIDTYLTDVLVLCTDCQQPIKARINTQQWIRVEWIGPEGECLGCYQLKTISNNKS